MRSCLSIGIGHGSWPRNYRAERTNAFLLISLAAPKQAVVPIAVRNAEKSGFSAFTKNVFLYPI